MALFTFLFLYAAMFLTALVFSALGLGGGSLYLPIQLFFHIDFHVAAATSLFLILITSLSSTLVFRKAKVVDWTMALVLEAATTVGGFLGGLYSGHFSGRALTFLFAAVIGSAAVFMMRGIKPKPNDAPELSHFHVWKRRLGLESYRINLAIALPASLLVGALSGLIGIGGGILKIPMMVLLFRVPMNVAVGSSAFMVGVTASGGFLGHLKAGHCDWKIALLLAPGVFLAGQVGARKSIKVDKKKMKVYFGYFLFGLAILLLIRTAVV
ncbi:MAG: sulfite exporter TauE/SafE family protein [Candidatus Acidiferrales bacterium]